MLLDDGAIAAHDMGEVLSHAKATLTRLNSVIESVFATVWRTVGTKEIALTADRQTGGVRAHRRSVKSAGFRAQIGRRRSMEVSDSVTASGHSGPTKPHLMISRIQIYAQFSGRGR